MSVIVTGMHRSGTSATARVVDAFGLTAGAGQMMGPAPDNPRGFFERRDVAEFNDAWLRRLGGSWWAPPATTALTWQHLDDGELEQARGQLDLFAAEGAPWYSKDPRTALLLPLWDRLALRQHPLIICLRHPGEVAVSLGLRNGVSTRRALALWHAYTAAAVNHAATRPALVIDYAAFLAAPTETAVALQEFLHDTGHAPGPDWSLERGARLLERPLHRASAPHWNDELLPHLERLLDLYRDLAKRHGQCLAETGHVALEDWVEETLDELREMQEHERRRAMADEEARVLRAERERLLAEHSNGRKQTAEHDRALAAVTRDAEHLRSLLAAAEQRAAAEGDARGVSERHLAELAAQRDTALAEVDRLGAALGAAGADAREISERHAAELAAERAAAQADLDRLSAELHAAEEAQQGEVRRAQALAATAQEECDRLRAALETAGRERAAGLAAHEALGRQVQEESTQRAAARAEAERLAVALAASESAKDAEVERAGQLASSLRERTTEAADLSEELAATRAEVATLRSEVERFAPALRNAEEGARGEAERAALLEAQLAKGEERIAQLRGALADAHGQHASVSGELVALREELERTTERLVAEEQSLVARAAQLGTAEAENRKRRSAMTEMSAELERRRARAYRAETAAAELQQRVGDLEAQAAGLQQRIAGLAAVQGENRTLAERLAAVTLERDELRSSLAQVLERESQALERELQARESELQAREGELQARTALAEVWISNSWRCGRVVTAPVRYAKRLRARPWR